MVLPKQESMGPVALCGAGVSPEGSGKDFTLTSQRSVL